MLDLTSEICENLFISSKIISNNNNFMIYIYFYLCC